MLSGSRKGSNISYYDSKYLNQITQRNVGHRVTRLGMWYTAVHMVSHQKKKKARTLSCGKWELVLVAILAAGEQQMASRNGYQD
jgi:hypothetical protein